MKALALATRGYICKGRDLFVEEIKPCPPVTDEMAPEITTRSTSAPKTAGDIIPELKPKIRVR